MKYLIFSDTHLTDKFDNHKFNYLKKIISSADKVIIAGDFYDQYFIDLDEFLSSQWKKLFPFLKEKKAVYLPGNHDLLTGTDKEYLFCDQITDEYRFNSGNEKFLVKHGHKIAPGLERYTFLTNFMRKILTKTHNLSELTLIKIFGRISISFYVYRYLGLKKTIKFKIQNIPAEEWLILGHIHLTRLDKKLKYANVGFINFGLASYITVENGEVELHMEKY